MSDSSYSPNGGDVFDDDDFDDEFNDDGLDEMTTIDEGEQILPCPDCRGKGTIGGGDQCPSCAGSGFAVKRE